jgi:AcrR family transcriptional regulator
VRRSADQVRAHILQAAETDFARYGVAGARIDRIALEAGASKERLYAYFGDKQGLFDEVIRRAAERVHTAVPIEDDDLVGFAGRLCEHFFTRPDELRMLTWTRLEEQAERAFAVDTVRAQQTANADAIRRAQHAGLVDPSWDPHELLQLILAIATYWAGATGLPTTPSAVYRAVVEQAVRRLIQPRPRRTWRR